MKIRALLAALAVVVAALGIGVAAAPAVQADSPYPNCKAAAGRYNIPRGDPAYQQKLDRDNDGIACESH